MGRIVVGPDDIVVVVSIVTNKNHVVTSTLTLLSGSSRSCAGYGVVDGGD